MTAIKNRKKKSSIDVQNRKWEEFSGSESLAQQHLVNAIVDLPLESIEPHKDNRHLANDESIEDLAASIDAMGQLEPATVRQTESGKYELLSGERRYRALQKLGRTYIRATVVSAESNQALVRLAAANSQRKDLDPIERAELIAKLMQPIEKGGSGLERMAAGLAVGFKSDSATKNALRMLRLPAEVRDMVRSGKLSERAARKLIPFVDHPEIMDEVFENLKDDEQLAELASSDHWPYWFEHVIDRHTRPMDDTKRRASDLVKGCWDMYPMLFELSDEYERQLAPFDIYDGNHKRRVTSNCKLWDELQKPFVEKQYNEKNKPSKPKTKPVAGEKAAEVSDADLKERRKEQDRRLKQFTDEWKGFAIRCQLAATVPMDRRLQTLGFLLQASHQSGASDHKLMEAAYHEAGTETKKVNGSYTSILIPTGLNDEYLDKWWGALLWPVSRSTKVPKNYALVPAGELPQLDRMTRMQNANVFAIAEQCQVTFEDFWKSATHEGSQRLLLSYWLGRHTTEQLKVLMIELKLNSGDIQKRSELVEYVMSCHTSVQQLPIPKRLK